MKGDCKGCRYRKMLSGCSFTTLISASDFCPCQECLIKPICTIDCFERLKVWVQLYKKKRWGK